MEIGKASKRRRRWEKRHFHRRRAASSKRRFARIHLRESHEHIDRDAVAVSQLLPSAKRGQQRRMHCNHGKSSSSRRRPASQPVAAAALSPFDRGLIRSATHLLTTKSGSRMPNWIALTRLTGADEYGKRSSVAIERRGPVCRRLSLFGASLTALLLSLLLRRCHAPRKGSRTCARAYMRRARAAAEMRRRDGHERARCLVFFCLFFCCLSLSLSSRRWAAEVNRGLLSGIAIGTDGATQKKTSAVKKHEGSAFSSSPRRCKRALRVPFSSQRPLLYRLPALPKRDGGGESIFVEKFARKRRPSIVFFLLCRRSLLLSLLDLLLRAEENTRPCSAF